MAGKYNYPPKRVSVHRFTGSIVSFFEQPTGPLKTRPPIQVEYLGAYLKTLGCQTVVSEDHYIDRDYIEDFSLFHARSLRDYPNYCSRLHFFTRGLTEAELRSLEQRARNEFDAVCSEMTETYLGFTVVRPLPGRPIGRTVLRSVGPRATSHIREFHVLREYETHLCGLRLRVTGLAFQQQDQAVSACATAATWSALQSTAYREHLLLRSPAEITVAASRYLMMNGRALPSEGLAIQQICEAIRDAGLAPVVLRATSFDVDRPALDTYLRSGFPPILAVWDAGSTSSQEGHAICAVGAKLGDVRDQTDPALTYRDGSTALEAVYVHDDRLGPYAVANLSQLTDPKDGVVRTTLQLDWPGTDAACDTWRLAGMIVPVPNKLRLSAVRLRSVGHLIGQAIGAAFPEMQGTVTVRTRYCLAVAYLREAYAFKLSDEGLEQLVEQRVLSRYLAIVEVCGLEERIADILFDSTEAVEHPSALAVINRSSLSKEGLATLAELATQLAAPFVR